MYLKTRLGTGEEVEAEEQQQRRGQGLQQTKQSKFIFNFYAIKMQTKTLARASKGHGEWTRRKWDRQWQREGSGKAERKTGHRKSSTKLRRSWREVKRGRGVEEGAQRNGKHVARQGISLQFSRSLPLSLPSRYDSAIAWPMFNVLLHIHTHTRT